eukprot:COSAG01_NODE_16623_length_1220_cov_1.064228_1_plen_93_part_10
MFEHVKVELTQTKVELQTELSKELEGNPMLLQMLMQSMEMLIDMHKEMISEGIADPTEPAQDLFKQLDIDKYVREYRSRRCSPAVGAKDACLR